MDKPSEEKIIALKEYFSERADISMAFIFGSRSQGNAHNGSDWDIAVYFKPLISGRVEWEDERLYPEEDVVWNDCMNILKTDNVDLAVLNRVPANLADTALRGIPLVVKDDRLLKEFMLIVSREGEDYRSFTDDFFAVSERSRSLSPADKTILEKTIRFIEQEAESYARFYPMTQKIYETDANERRNVERWAENIMNSFIDSAKILLASSKKPIPDTYRETLRRAVWMLNLKEECAVCFERWAKLRNVLAHEYLDVKWKRIKDFIQKSEPYLKDFTSSVKKFIKEG